MKHLIIPIALFAVALPAASATNEWIPLFNGRNLDGWTPKINHHALGENYLDTFVVRDGVLRISYERSTRPACASASLRQCSPQA